MEVFGGRMGTGGVRRHTDHNPPLLIAAGLWESVSAWPSWTGSEECRSADNAGWGGALFRGFVLCGGVRLFVPRFVFDCLWLLACLFFSFDWTFEYL